MVRRIPLVLNSKFFYPSVKSAWLNPTSCIASVAVISPTQTKAIFALNSWQPVFLLLTLPAKTFPLLPCAGHPGNKRKMQTFWTSWRSCGKILHCKKHKNLPVGVFLPAGSFTALPYTRGPRSSEAFPEALCARPAFYFSG